MNTIKSKFIDRDIQSYVNEKSLRLNEHQLNMIDYTIKQGKNKN